jgi:hypothetical protein
MVTENDMAPTMVGENKHEVLIRDMDMNSQFMREQMKRWAKLGNKDHFSSEPVSDELKDIGFCYITFWQWKFIIADFDKRLHIHKRLFDLH